MPSFPGSLASAEPLQASPTEPDDRARSRAAGAHASLALWLVNLAVGVILGRLWLHRPLEESAIHVRLFLPVALVSSVAMWALFPALWMTLCHLTVRSLRWSAVLQGFAGAFFLVFLYADTIVYRLLGYHMNSAAWNVLRTPGSADAVHLGFRVWGPVALALLLITAAQGALWHGFYRMALQRQASAPTRWWRPLGLVAGCLLAVVLVEKSGFAAAHIARDHELKNACRPLPLFPRLSLAHPSEDPAPLAELLTEGRLDYPAADPVLDPAGPRPNIIMLVIDSWRRDAFAPDVTPNLWAYAQEGRVFQDHLSGGNGTRFGLFTLLYGLHGTYWFPVLEERRAPVLLETLAALDYDVNVFSSASMTFPEFDQTAWVGLEPGRVHDDYPAHRPHERDAQMAEGFTRWLASRTDERPFFAFLLLDAPHQPYSNDGGPFQPAAERFDYVELATQTDRALVERVSNRYKNSVVFADRIAGGILDALEGSSAAEDTVVLVTGDHGEEFCESGFWGHTSNFTPAQVDVPFFMKGPGIEPGTVARPTSHVDVPGSLLELLGADPAHREDYCLGESLFAPLAVRDRVVSGWSSVGVVSTDDILCLSVDRGEVEFFDTHWRSLPDVERLRTARAPQLQTLRLECAAFLRPVE